MANDYPTPGPAGCVNALVGLGSFITGIYHGVRDAKGLPIEPSLDNMLMYGPSIVGAVVGTYVADEMKDHPMMREKLSEIPPEARGCAVKGQGIIGGAIMMAVANGAGYVVGRYIIGNMS